MNTTEYLAERLTDLQRQLQDIRDTLRAYAPSESHYRVGMRQCRNCLDGEVETFQNEINRSRQQEDHP